MAQRRMFSKGVVRTDKFLDMAQSTQNLYFHLGIEADDDGFVSPKMVMRSLGCTDDELKMLVVKEFVIPFESGVVVITDWKENNYIQADRYKATLFREEAKQIQCIQNVYKLDTQVRVGKDRLGKVRKEISISPKGEEKVPNEVNLMIDLFKEVNPSYQVLFRQKGQRDACTRLLKKYDFKQIKELVEKLKVTNQTPFMPSITTPSQLEAKLGTLIAQMQKKAIEQKNSNLINNIF